jgi:hypothetical protein
MFDPFPVFNECNAGGLVSGPDKDATGQAGECSTGVREETRFFAKTGFLLPESL